MKFRFGYFIEKSLKFKILLRLKSKMSDIEASNILEFLAYCGTLSVLKGRCIRGQKYDMKIGLDQNLHSLAKKFF